MTFEIIKFTFSLGGGETNFPRAGGYGVPPMGNIFF